MLQSYFVKDRVPEGMVKADVVNFAKLKWPLSFSKVYEATQISGTVMFENWYFCIELNW